MDTYELETYMQRDPKISHFYRGVLPKDLLPLRPLFIVNQDTSNKDGSHWIVVYLGGEGNLAEYFDPLGKEPDGDFKSYLTLQSRGYMFNTQRCQNYLSNLCGHYCLFYCYFKARGHSMGIILNRFDKQNLYYKDQLVFHFFLETIISLISAEYNTVDIYIYIYIYKPRYTGIYIYIYFIYIYIYITQDKHIQQYCFKQFLLISLKIAG